MAQLVRFGVSMDTELLSAFDDLIDRKGYANRSEALRDLVRDALVEDEWDEEGGATTAALCIVYDHHTRDLQNRLVALQHAHADRVTAALHVHLDEHNCLETIILHGPPAELRELADRVISARGVKHGKLVATTTGRKLS